MTVFFVQHSTHKRRHYKNTSVYTWHIDEIKTSEKIKETIINDKR